MEQKEQAEEVDEEEAAEEEEQAPEEQKPEEPVKTKSSDELKVVMILNAGKVMLGVQSPDCDPVYTTFEGTLPAALKRVPKLVKEAKQKWSDSPRNPNANLPAPEPAPAPARTAASSQATDKRQPSFF